jgi:ParB-like chromosome segregation protein Spo0J
MKFTRSTLKKLIIETLREERSILLEMPPGPIVGQEQKGDYTKDPDGYEGEMAKRSLFHMAQQAQQLHDLLLGDENLDPWVQDKITKSATALEAAFKAITYDKGPGQGRMP